MSLFKQGIDCKIVDTTHTKKKKEIIEKRKENYNSDTYNDNCFCCPSLILPKEALNCGLICKGKVT